MSGRATKWLLAAGVAVVVLAPSACASRGLSRSEVRDKWVATYVEEFDITEPQAACMVDKFFAEIDDDELRPLTKGEELTDEQAVRIGGFAIKCGVGPTSGSA